LDCIITVVVAGTRDYYTMLCNDHHNNCGIVIITRSTIHVKRIKLICRALQPYSYLGCNLRRNGIHLV